MLTSFVNILIYNGYENKKEHVYFQYFLIIAVKKTYENL